MESYKLFKEHPEFGKKLEEMNLKVPGWSFLDSYRPGWVLFEGLKDTTADPKLLPALHNYRVFQKLIASCDIPGDGDAWVWPVGLETCFAKLDTVLLFQIRLQKKFLFYFLNFGSINFMCELCDHTELEKRDIRDNDLCPKCSLGAWVQPGEDGKTRVEKVLNKDFSKELLDWYKIEIDYKEVINSKTGKTSIHSVKTFFKTKHFVQKIIFTYPKIVSS